MSNEENAVQEVSVDVAAPEEQAPQATLSLNDLGVLANIINLATTRGAFKANELSSVGAAYDKLNFFLTAAQAQAKSASTENNEQPSE